MTVLGPKAEAILTKIDMREGTNWKKGIVAGVLITVGVLGLGALAIAMFGSPIRSDVPIGFASLISPTRIEIGGECGTDEHVSVEESEESVHLRLSLKTRPGDCASGATVELEQPLGEREVIDATTGQPLPVEGS